MAKTYYFSSSTGNDSYTSTQAQNPATPWASISKLNSFFSSIVAGDTIAFKCGDTFYGEIVIGASGNSTSPITLTSYGTGAKPVITGFSSVTSWTNIGTNLWESTSAVTTSSLMLNMITVNNTFQAIGRYPKFTGSSSDWIITTTNTWAGGSWPIAGSVKGVLAGSKDFTGGEVVMRKNHWVIDRATITSQSYSGGSITVNFSQPQPPITTAYAPSNGWGFFLQNHVSACTQQGDWAYNTSTKKIQMYSVGTPTGVKVANIDTLIYNSGHQYISFYGLNITGANWMLLQLYNNCSHNTVSNCDFSFCGYEGIYIGGLAQNVTIDGCTLSYINSNGIYSQRNCSNLTVQNSTISNINMVAGMGQSGDGDGFSLMAYGDNSLIQYNTLQNCGYNGIVFLGTNIIIKNNFIQNVCQVKDDGGAVYVYEGYVPNSNGTGKQIINNIILNCGSNYVDYGTDGAKSASGIYLDGSASNITVNGNTVAHCTGHGFQGNSPTNDIITNNTFYDTYIAGIGIVEYGANTPSNLTFTNNIVFSINEGLIGSFQRRSSSISSWGTFDYNYYCRPLHEPSSITQTGCSNSYNYNSCTHGGIIERFDILSGNGPDYSLDTWKSSEGVDLHTQKTPITITDLNKIRFEYNETSVDKDIDLGIGLYIDVQNNNYSGTLTLSPYTSVILLETSEARPVHTYSQGCIIT